VSDATTGRALDYLHFFGTITPRKQDDAPVLGLKTRDVGGGELIADGSSLGHHAMTHCAAVMGGRRPQSVTSILSGSQKGSSFRSGP